PRHAQRLLGRVEHHLRLGDLGAAHRRDLPVADDGHVDHQNPFPARPLTSRSGSPVGIHPSMPPLVLLHPPAASSSRLRSPSGCHTAATRMPTRTSPTGVSRTSWSCSMPPGPSSAIETRANGSVSSCPGYCTGVTTVKLTTVPWSP